MGVYHEYTISVNIMQLIPIPIVSMIEEYCHRIAMKASILKIKRVVQRAPSLITDGALKESYCMVRLGVTEPSYYMVSEIVKSKGTKYTKWSQGKLSMTKTTIVIQDMFMMFINGCMHHVSHNTLSGDIVIKPAIGWNPSFNRYQFINDLPGGGFSKVLWGIPKVMDSYVEWSYEIEDPYSNNCRYYSFNSTLVEEDVS